VEVRTLANEEDVPKGSAWVLIEKKGGGLVFYLG